MNGTYHLHASTSGWANFFNDTYGNDSLTLSHCQVWAAFIQESTWQASEMAKIDFVIQDVASIEEVTEEALTILGNNGLIQPAMGTTLSACQAGIDVQKHSTLCQFNLSPDIFSGGLWTF